MHDLVRTVLYCLIYLIFNLINLCVFVYIGDVVAPEGCSMVSCILTWVGSLISVDFDHQLFVAWRHVLTTYQPFLCTNIEVQSKL